MMERYVCIYLQRYKNVLRRVRFINVNDSFPNDINKKRAFSFLWTNIFFYNSRNIKI